MSEQWTIERIIVEAEAIVADSQTNCRMRQHIITAMMQMRNDMQAEIDALRNACMNEDHAISQSLGEALGYPRYCDDPKNFPGATEADGVCVGDQVSATLAKESADRIRAQALQIETLQHQLAQLAKLAITPGQWQPVEDGIRSHDEPHQLYNEANGISICDEDGTLLQGFRYPNDGNKYSLCQRVEVESTKASDK